MEQTLDGADNRKLDRYTCTGDVMNKWSSHNTSTHWLATFNCLLCIP